MHVSFIPPSLLHITAIHPVIGRWATAGLLLYSSIHAKRSGVRKDSSAAYCGRPHCGCSTVSIYVSIPLAINLVISVNMNPWHALPPAHASSRAGALLDLTMITAWTAGTYIQIPSDFIFLFLLTMGSGSHARQLEGGDSNARPEPHTGNVRSLYTRSTHPTGAPWSA